MKQRKIIIRLGIESMILFTFQSANAQDIKYTKSGTSPASWQDW